MQDATIFIVDDDPDILMAGKLLLKRHFSNVITSENPEQIPELLASHNVDAILLDMNFGPGESSGEQGYRWLKAILQIKPLISVVMITAHGDVDTAVEAMKLGATDFIAKPWQNEKVVATLSAAVKLSQTRDEASQLKQTNQLLAKASSHISQQAILGNSAAIRHVMSLVERSAPTDANVLILGENGTGKELIARELHQQSLRNEQVFMSVDLGSVSESLFESELFGHKKGAFTGAREERVGRLKAADGGTLFLDEIGNLPLHLQAKLLTVLAQRQVTPLGANSPVDFNVRVIAATNLSREQLADENQFRPDLLFRLNTVEITLPPLRERQEDIALIAQFYVELYCRKYQRPLKTIAPSTLVSMQHYSWPGNIRALRHAVERAVILAQGNELTEDDFQLEKSSIVPLAAQAANQEDAAPQANSDNQFNLEQLEKQTISRALQTHRYNISYTAKALGLTRAALYRRMEKHGL
ncbi:AAA family ATPase [Paraglaciecola hydrolytica]|uniref:AAA family ATPase n=2 Tax=Paraglaciecola hydrolytica TaxID=1799789 RepID=A0A136A2B9_9ALTE|nr:AAA family ATPase [Paraglaciecola hydrolytica]